MMKVDYRDTGLFNEEVVRFETIGEIFAVALNLALKEAAPKRLRLEQKLKTMEAACRRTIGASLSLPDDHRTLQLRDAELVLQLIDRLRKQADSPPSAEQMSAAIFNAIALGAIFIKMQVRGHEPGVLQFKSVKAGRAKGRQQQAAKSHDRRAEVVAEMERRATLNPRLSRTDIAQQMAQERVNDKPRWGAVRTILRYTQHR
jgi:hypothetical protein